MLVATAPGDRPLGFPNLTAERDLDDLDDLLAIAEIPGKIVALALDIVVGRGPIH